MLSKSKAAKRALFLTLEYFEENIQSLWSQNLLSTNLSRYFAIDIL